MELRCATAHGLVGDSKIGTVHVSMLSSVHWSCQSRWLLARVGPFFLIRAPRASCRVDSVLVLGMAFKLCSVDVVCATPGLLLEALLLLAFGSSRFVIVVR